MGLKQSIIVVNEYTCRTAGGGTRGSSPGSYIIDYMSRDGATEVLTPVKLKDYQDGMLQYMLREDTISSAGSVLELKQDFYKLQGLGGKAFGYGQVSLSDASLRSAAADVERHFKEGKTVLKTLISFDETYLRENGIIRPEFHLRASGDYRGNIDQLKLRMSIMNGLQKAARGYDDLQYVGVIQVDTEHVHCHLAMYDRGTGTLMPDGTQRGKLTDREMQDLRRGVDTYLEEKQSVMTMVSGTEYRKQNTIGFIKRFTHKMMDQRGLSQFMIACLPKERYLWQADTKEPEMQKPNRIVREYVKQVLSEPDSGYEHAMQQIYDHARAGISKKAVTDRYAVDLVNRKREKIITDGMNAVYSVLQEIPEEAMDQHTPLLDVMGISYEEAAGSAGTDSIAGFGFRLRSYKTRLDHHAGEFQKYHINRVDYERQMKDPEERNRPAPASRVMYDFYNTEETYHEMLMDKYLYFLDFVPFSEHYREEQEALDRYGKEIMTWRRISHDRELPYMQADRAEEYGLKIYNISGGAEIAMRLGMIQERLLQMQEQYESLHDRYAMKLAVSGLMLTEDDEVIRGKRYTFDEVKALDLHHMTYDFPSDIVIPKQYTDQFVAMADKRFSAFKKAKGYLVASGQTDSLEDLSGDDILAQYRFSEQFREKTGILQAKERTQIALPGHTQTIRLDDRFYVQQEETIREDIKSIVENTVLSLQYG